MNDRPVAIVGGGLAGLCCALRLQELGVDYRLFEAAEAVGGRVRTDEVEGFRLDRGFQVLLDSYPEARRVLDFSALDLRAFDPGALVRVGNRFYRVSDPFRDPFGALAGLRAPIGSFADKLRVARLRRDVVQTPVHELLRREETTTADSLRQRGFSEQMIDRFFRPFFGGVFLERELETSSRWFELLFRCFSQGSATLPREGIQAIPEQLASRLDAQRVHLKAPVERVEERSLRLAGGETVDASAVVLASDQGSARSLLGVEVGPSLPWRGVHTLYFSCDTAPVQAPVLVLGGEGGVINNLCFPSVLSSGLAPAGKHLVSVTVLEARAETVLAKDRSLEQRVRGELVDWFGQAAMRWPVLRTDQVRQALLAQPPGAFDPHGDRSRRTGGVFVCGDYVETSSIQGAMVSGRKAADEVFAAIAGQGIGPADA